AGVSLYTNNAPATDFRATGVLSYANSDRDRIEFVDQESDLLEDPTNYFNGRSAAGARAAAEQLSEVTEDWFVSTDFHTLRPEIAADGSIDMHGLFELTDAAPPETGARLSSNPDPTELELFPTVTPGQDEDDGDTDGGGPGEDDTPGDGDAPADDGIPDDESSGDGATDGDSAGGDSTPADTSDEDAAAGTGEDTDPTGIAGDEAEEQGSSLARTGAEVAPLALVVLALLGAGAVLVRRSTGRLARCE